MRSTGQSVGDFEELLQDARVAFLGHIRRMENMSRIRACHFTILHALYDRCMDKNAICLSIASKKRLGTTASFLWRRRRKSRVKIASKTPLQQSW